MPKALEALDGQALMANFFPTLLKPLNCIIICPTQKVFGQGVHPLVLSAAAQLSHFNKSLSGSQRCMLFNLMKDFQKSISENFNLNENETFTPKSDIQD